MVERRGAIRTAAVVAAIAVSVDQAAKLLILQQVMEPPRAVPLTPFLSLTLGFNTGVSFGVLGDTFARSPFLLSALMALVVGLVRVMIWRTRSVWNAAGYGLIVGGAVGNIADRLRLGAVVDFIDLHYAGWHWPAFNTADAAIFCGVAMLLIGAPGRGRHPGAAPPWGSTTSDIESAGGRKGC